MAQIIDISSKITNELPKIVITQDICVTVNNRKSTILNIQAMQQEAERKAKSNESAEEDPEADMKLMNKAMVMLIGEKSTNAIEELDLPITEYKEVFQTIMKVAQGVYSDSPSEK